MNLAGFGHRRVEEEDELLAKSKPKSAQYRGKLTVSRVIRNW